tara:strand:+ start:59 stop:571 length:513 start_codon:yes stop_codon:yes gene_type:complete
MKTIKTYWNTTEDYKTASGEWIPWLRTITIDEFSKPAFGTIQVAGQSHQQDLMSTLKRIHHKAINHINHTIREAQKQEKKLNHIVDGKTGFYYTKRRHKTKPLHQDLEYLKLLEKLFLDSEQWEIVCDEYDMPVAKNLKYRHPYAKDLKGILVLAHLKNSGTKQELTSGI